MLSDKEKALEETIDSERRLINKFGENPLNHHTKKSYRKHVRARWEAEVELGNIRGKPTPIMPEVLKGEPVEERISRVEDRLITIEASIEKVFERLGPEKKPKKQPNIQLKS